MRARACVCDAFVFVGGCVIFFLVYAVAQTGVTREKCRSRTTKYFQTLTGNQTIKTQRNNQITGNTIFNALRMGDIEADKDDRPLEPPRLISVEVLLNPFDDIVPRNLSGRGSAKSEAEAAAAAADAAAAATKKRRKKQGKKDFKLLSFGEEADQEEKELDALEAGARAGGRGVKSAHDALDDDKFSKDAAYDAEAARKVDGVSVTTEEGLRRAVKSAAKGREKGSRYVTCG